MRIVCAFCPLLICYNLDRVVVPLACAAIVLPQTCGSRMESPFSWRPTLKRSPGRCPSEITSSPFELKTFFPEYPEAGIDSGLIIENAPVF